MFLHAGVIHFFFNMVGFVQVGAMVERVFGWWRVSKNLAKIKYVKTQIVESVSVVRCECRGERSLSPGPRFLHAGVPRFPVTV